MAETVAQAFDQSVDWYDDWMRRALPDFHGLFRSALDQVPFEADASISVLDLGAGTGLFAWHVFEKFPAARFTLCDLAPKMLDVARLRFDNCPDQFTYLVEDYLKMTPDQSYDLVISSLSIHHLSHEDKRVLFGRIHDWLSVGGMFLNIDQVWGPTQYWHDLYWNQWLERVRRGGAAEDQIQASIQRRQEFDREASLIDQLRWLEEAGFGQVDCVYKNAFIGVFCAVKS